MKTQSRGFTLVELMITVIIISVLSAIAYPTYTRFVERGRQADAKQAMLAISNRQQQYLLNNRIYVTDIANLANLGYTLDADLTTFYTFTLSTTAGVTSPNYTLTATAIGQQAGNPTMTINHAGVKTPADQW